MKGAVTWIGFTLAAFSAVWGGEAPASAGKGFSEVGGEVETADVPFDIYEVIRTVRKNRGLPEEPPKQGFGAEARGKRPFASKGGSFTHSTPRFQAEVRENKLRYFAQGNKEKPDFEILSVRFERGGVTRTVFGKNRLEEHAPGLLKGKVRDGVTSYVRNCGEEGLEIYWTIDEPLSSEASALRVRLAIRAAGGPREHDEGFVFPTWDGSGGVAFSDVTVVDAAGRRERARPTLATSQEILFEVSHEFLENSQYPILIDPTVGPEFPLNPSPVIGPAADRQEYPSVASNGTDYFVAWTDGRSWASWDIYGARVASDGTVLDPTGIAVSAAANQQLYPSVASNGTDYFVVWEDWRNDGGCYCNWDIYGARVRASDGMLLDGPPDTGGIAVSTAVGNQGWPSVASNGTDYFVAWSDDRSGSGYDIYGTRVTSAGIVLDPSGIAVSTAGGSQWKPSVASNGTDYIVVWGDYRSGTNYDIYGARVNSAGTVLDPTPTDIAVSTAVDRQYYPSVASNGTDYFVAWSDERNDGGCQCNTDIYGARVRASDGYLHDGPPDTGGIAVSTAVGDQERPSVASDGTDYFVAWRDYRSGVDYDIYGTRVASDGTVLDPTPTDIAVSTATNHQMYPSVASNGTNYFVAWEDQRNGSTNRDVYGARVTLAGAVPDDPLVGIAVSTAANHQYEPSVASDGSDYFVAWYDRRSGTNNDIYGARVTSAGAVPDDPLVGIAVSTAATDQRYPSVASNGTDYFVAWEDWRNGSTNRDVYGARVTSAGAVPDDTLVGIAVSTAANNQRLPSVASNGTDYFVVWQDYRSGTGYSDIYGTRVTSAGAVPDDPLVGIAVSTSASEQRFPSVASNGTDYFVVWEDYREGPADIYGARVTAAGVVLDASGIAVSTAVSDQEDLSVASNGTDYFVAWRDYRSGTGYDIYGTRVTSAGAVPDDPLVGIAVSTAASSQRFPSVASDGTDYFVVWEDRRYWATTKYDIYGTRVRASDGWLLDGPPDTGGIAVSTAANSQYSPSAASNGTDYFVVWEDYRDGPGNLYGARVTAAGVVLDTSGIAVSTAAWDQEWPSVASNGTDYFAAWRDYRNDAGCFCNPDIYGTRVTSDGMVLDAAGIAVSTAANWQVDPSVASNEADYFVVWMDGRSGTDYDIYGARVTSLYGTVLDAAGILIQQSPYGDSYPAVAYSACGKYLVTYYRFYDDPNFQSSRVMALTVEDDVPSAGEVSAQDSGKPLTVERASGQVKIFWEGLPSDCAGVIQYNIYEGNLDAPFYTHLSAVCWTAGTDEEGGYLSEIITPGYTNAYYLVTECDMATEGPSGYDSDAVERNPLLNTCGPHP
ncbi:MAG: hypothetical protein JSV08_01490 [Acidobacteriota bacterium]|nr:MAG: hypothetical protein JSV08_01490 [Acidobacteriota bacterium]